MKTFLNLILLSLIFFFSCRQRESDKQEANTPEALQDKGYELPISSRKQSDVVEELYREQMEKTPKLKEIDEKIRRIQDTKHDSLKGFNSFNGKNDSYYTSAKDKLSAIEDSVLRTKLKSMIEASQNNYETNILKHKHLVSLLNKKSIALSDLYTILKVVITLPVIEKYQQHNIPSTIPMEKAVKSFDAIISGVDSLIKK